MLDITTFFLNAQPVPITLAVLSWVRLEDIDVMLPQTRAVVVRSMDIAETQAVCHSFCIAMQQ
jgi:hypothetical protein